ncbi:MAG TPA: hypothetical protein VGM90_03825 [Kofleriaceae bacterium]|jgi:hypothetical protein
MALIDARNDAYLRALLTGKQVIGRAVRESAATLRRRPVTTPRTWIALSALAVMIAACGGNKTQSNYSRGVQVQEQCCESLAGDARDACLKQVVRVDDPTAQKTATNEQTYACVVDHFVCDPTTGHETAASAQSQHDCTDELQ